MKAKIGAARHMETRPCLSCGQGAMRRGERRETIKVDGYEHAYMQPGWYCDSCEDGVLVDEDNMVADAALREAKAHAKGAPITPLGIRAVRELLHLSQRDAGRIFGGGARAFQRYESGAVAPSTGMANMLRLALEQPGVFRRALKQKDLFKRRGHLVAPSSREIGLIRNAATDDALASIVRRVYPEAFPGGNGGKRQKSAPTAK
ncbi:MAG: type II toxin-antitoxin system MqsA family antitoxin [Proteobacteria bacterium]|nr:type II toxin-antitoxin system MqsA family antitoxin [Pseudomonadota bacterium]MBI3498531.1 type II toxin-antitoxin system MqsA family antitoxin [Pseudomonadota bacterium]